MTTMIIERQGDQFVNTPQNLLQWTKDKFCQCLRSTKLKGRNCAHHCCLIVDCFSQDFILLTNTMIRLTIIKKNIQLKLAYISRVLFHYHHQEKCGGMQKHMVLEKELKVLHLDSQAEEGDNYNSWSQTLSSQRILLYEIFYATWQHKKIENIFSIIQDNMGPREVIRWINDIAMLSCGLIQKKYFLEVTGLFCKRYS